MAVEAALEPKQSLNKIEPPVDIHIHFISQCISPDGLILFRLHNVLTLLGMPDLTQRK